MGLIFRSEDMSHLQLVLQAEAAYSIVTELGNIGKMEFIDIQGSQRQYIDEVKRCEEMERNLEFIMKQVKAAMIRKEEKEEPSPDPLQPNEIIELEMKLGGLQREIQEIMSNKEQLESNYRSILEQKHTVRVAQKYFSSSADMSDWYEELAEYRGGERQELLHVQGVVDLERLPGFERLMWRAGQGNILMKYEEIEEIDPHAGNVPKAVFLVLYQGEGLRNVVKKICNGYHASVYNIPESPVERSEMLDGLSRRIKDMNTVMNQTEKHLRDILEKSAAQIAKWTTINLKMKAIFHTLNKFNYDTANRVLVAEGWCETKQLPLVRETIMKGQAKSGSPELVPYINILPTVPQNAPTYFRTNKFTKVFQNIVNAYGAANYKEINGAPFYTISFPFLFGVMFGDMGHGFCLVLLALYFLWNEKKFLAQKGENDMFDMIFAGRYIILLMGLFAMYGGFIYNDIFSKSVDFFGTAWFAPNNVYNLTTVLTKTQYVTLNPTLDYSHVPYPIGMDPIWQLSINQITWLNSFKMKLSVIFGVTHMFFGVMLSLINSLYFRSKMDIICEFIPEVIFLACIFGYMNITIFYKWFVYNAVDSACAPALLIEIIDMAMMSYPKSPCSVETFYPNQETVQKVLILLALISVPWLLVPKPLILRSRHNQKVKMEEECLKLDEFAKEKELKGGNTNNAFTIDMEGGKGLPTSQNAKSLLPKEKEPEFEFGEVFVHQAIHTIEYCLGCISHTASYLRLWALSLAHAELSEVIWDMVLMIAFKFVPGYPQIPVLFIFWAGWCWLTIAIMIMMEGMSAFLHTLRLHWVEFQSKFYKGEGHLFAPLNFRKLKSELM